MYDPGRYRLRITSAALGETKDGAPQIEVGVSITGAYTGISNQELVGFSGPPRTVYMPLTELCLGSADKPGWVAQALADLGFVGPSFNDLDPLIGQERDGQCQHDDYTGQLKEKWSIYRQTRTPKRPVDAKGARALDAKHKDLLKGFFKQPAGTAPAKPPTPGAAPARPPARPPQRPAPRPTPAPKAGEPEPEPHPEANGPVPEDRNLVVDPETGASIPF